MPYIKGALLSPGFQKKPFHYLHSVWRVFLSLKKNKNQRARDLLRRNGTIFSY